MRSQALTHHRPWAVALLGLTLAACGGGDDPAPAPPAAPPTPASVSISGTAAVGTPVVGASVSAHCSSADAVTPAITDANGQWTLTLGSAAALPCALQISGGTVAGAAFTQMLHSYAAAAGVVNVTPLTDLTVALAAALPPEAWFAALDASHAPALGATLEAARTQLLQALADGGYTLPPGTAFDPLTTPFAATADDAYDALLEGFAAGLQASGTSYSQLLDDVLSAGAGGHGISVPGVGIDVPGEPTTGGQSGPIVLGAKGNVVAADVAPLVGSFPGTLGRTTPTGQASTYGESCAIEATSGGTLSVSVGGRRIAATMSGDVGDLILSINTIRKAMAFDFDSNSVVTIEVVRGYVAQATATDNDGALSCTLPNPHSAGAGSASVQVLNGANAGDFDSALVGVYANDTCSVSVGSTGTLHLVSGSVDVSGTLGGDEQDVVVLQPTINAQSLSTADLRADGSTLSMSFSIVAAQPSLGLGDQISADARITDPRPFQTLASCTGLVRQ